MARIDAEDSPRYLVLEIETDAGVLDFEGWRAELTPLSIKRAAVLVTDPKRPLSGPLLLDHFTNRKLAKNEYLLVRSITYVIDAPRSRGGRQSQAYVHPFVTDDVRLDRSFNIFPGNGAKLFDEYFLQDLVDGKVPADARSLQFIA